MLAGAAGTSNSSYDFWWKSTGDWCESKCETWDGTCMDRSEADLNTAQKIFRGKCGGVGTVTAALAFGGYPPALPTQIQKLMGWNFLDRSK